jgi:hypothetical protein
LLCYHVVAREWDALHLYIANNLDWMENWIEYIEEYLGRLSWEGVSKMIKTTHHHQDQFPDLTSREVDNRQVKFVTHIFLVFSQFFNVFGLFNY